MAQRRIKAKYRTVGPQNKMVSYTKAWIDEETKSLQQEQVEEEMQTWMVYFPAGHSIRFCGDRGLKEMKRMGYHLKPKLVDMDTGDVIDIGGDEYDFGTPGEADEVVVLDDSEEDVKSTRKTSTKVTENAT